MVPTPRITKHSIFPCSPNVTRISFHKRCLSCIERISALLRGYPFFLVMGRNKVCNLRIRFYNPSLIISERIEEKILCLYKVILLKVYENITNTGILIPEVLHTI